MPDRWEEAVCRYHASGRKTVLGYACHFDLHGSVEKRDGGWGFRVRGALKDDRTFKTHKEAMTACENVMIVVAEHALKKLRAK